jgi:hypothetical protein
MTTLDILVSQVASDRQTLFAAVADRIVLRIVTSMNQSIHMDVRSWHPNIAPMWRETHRDMSALADAITAHIRGPA